MEKIQKFSMEIHTVFHSKMISAFKHHKCLSNGICSTKNGDVGHVKENNCKQPVGIQTGGTEKTLPKSIYVLLKCI